MQDQCIREMMQWEESELQAISLIMYVCVCVCVASPLLPHNPSATSFSEELGCFAKDWYYIIWLGAHGRESVTKTHVSIHQGSPEEGMRRWTMEWMDEKVFKWLVSHMVNPRLTNKLTKMAVMEHFVACTMQ